MKNSNTRRLFVLGLSLFLTTGLLVGCGSGNSNSTSANASDQQAEQHAEESHEDEHSHEAEEHSDHEEEGHDEHGTDHFEGKKAETYEEAVSNIREANSKFEDILAKDEISEYDLRQVHKMSYTMENALKVIQEESDGNYDEVAKNLESVHLASEERDVETVRQDGQKYLEGAKSMLKEE